MNSVRLEDYERGLEARKAALGVVGLDYVQANTGLYRTDAKRNLLRKIADAARLAKQELRFYANF